MASHSQDTEETYTRYVTDKFNPNLTTVFLLMPQLTLLPLTSYRVLGGAGGRSRVLHEAKVMFIWLNQYQLSVLSLYFTQVAVITSRVERSWFWSRAHTHIPRLYTALWHLLLDCYNSSSREMRCSNPFGHGCTSVLTKNELLPHAASPPCNNSYNWYGKQWCVGRKIKEHNSWTYFPK